MHSAQRVRLQTHAPDALRRVPAGRDRLVRRRQRRTPGVREERGLEDRGGDQLGVRMRPTQRPRGVRRGDGVPSVDQPGYHHANLHMRIFSTQFSSFKT